MKDLRTIPRWERYRDFFRLTIFRYFVAWFSVVPLLYTLLAGLPRPLPIELAGEVYQLNLALPFNWQILWVSSLSYFLALLLYLWKCPAFVRRYNTFTDYKAHGHDPRWLAWEAKGLIDQGAGISQFVKRMTTKRYLEPYTGAIEDENPEVGVSETVFRFEHAGERWQLSMPKSAEGSLDEEAERAIFWEIYGRYSESRVVARTVIRVLLITSGLLFLIVLGQHMLAGGSAAAEWIVHAIRN